jgi:ABC-type cobalamin/Fe3+-siderophores transport system ATPase subunit
VKLKFVGPIHKSIKDLVETELPNFVVLTGPNGIGKTHLLRAIESGSITVDGVGPQASLPVRYYEHSSLTPNPSVPVVPPNIGAMIEAAWNSHRSEMGRIQHQLGRIGALGPAEQAVRELLHKVGWGNATLETLTAQSDPNQAAAAMEFLQRALDNLGDRGSLAKNIATKRGKRNLFALTKEDFLHAYPTVTEAVDLFQHSFSTLFASYRAHRYRNEFEEFRRQKHGPQHICLTDQEFLNIHGDPPWERVDVVLRTAGLPLRVVPPPEELYQSYEAKLQNISSGAEIGFSELSSGERVICALALAMYYADEPQQPVKYPSMLLLDEIDATLHPPYVAAALRVIEQIIVKNGVKVIMTTHSPTTVALAPASAVHVLERSPELVVRQIPKTKAIGTLLKGVPTISVEHENRRQIVVEDDSDVLAYEQLYLILSPVISPDVSLTFVSATMTNSGGDSAVSRILEAFKDNNKVVGLLDWDAKNPPAGRIQVLGINKRYTLENFLLDPMAVGAFLLQEAMVAPEELSLPPGTTYSKLVGGSLSERQTLLQQVADAVLEKVKAVAGDGLNETRNAHTYGVDEEKLSIELPEWFCKMNGHTWADHLTDRSFPQLGGFRSRRTDKSLVYKILTRIYADQPGMIPTEILELFISLQAI